MTKPSKDNLRARELTMQLLTGVLLGGSFGILFNFSVRQIIFFAILGCGVTLLIRLNRSKKEPEVQQPVVIEQEKVLETQELPGSSIDQLIQDPTRILQKTEARQWLDNFLVKQQGVK